MLKVKVFILALCFYKGILCAKLITSKELIADGQHFTWNFIFSEKASDISFNTYQENETGALNVDEDKLDLFNVQSSSLDKQRRECSNDGVYWREWNGGMPSDAIVGGHTINQCGLEVSIYLAQAYIPGGDTGVQPGQLFNYSREITTSYNGIHKTTKNVKVLCSGDKKSVAWVAYDKLKYLQPDKDCVIAGFEKDFSLFFGRAKYINEVIIGKVVLRENQMHYPYDGSERIEKNFEVLCYTRRLLENNIESDEN